MLGLAKAGFEFIRFQISDFSWGQGNDKNHYDIEQKLQWVSSFHFRVKKNLIISNYPQFVRGWISSFHSRVKKN